MADQSDTGINKMTLLKTAVIIQHRLPVNMAENDIIDFKEEASYKTYDCYLKEIGNTWVSPDSVVYKKGALFVESLASTDLKSYYQLRHLVKKILIGKKIRLAKSSKYLLVTDSWSAGHFHWFSDVLPKLMCIKEGTKDFVLLLPDVPYIRTIAVESLRLLQISFQDIIFMSEKAFYHADSLYYLSRVSRSGHMHKNLMNEIREKFLTGRRLGQKKIYISRGKAICRKVVNEDALCHLLKNYGFDILYGEELNLTDQVDLFSSTSTLLGVHGAGLMNALFMHPGSNVVELRRKENGPSNVGYWHLADSLDHNFYYYNGIPDSPLPLVGQGCNLEIPIADFEKKILHLI